MASVQKQFESFHETIRTDYLTNDELREKRDIILGKIERSLRDSSRPSFRRLMQGSYIMRTGVKPIEREYDIDVGLHFDIKDTQYSANDVRSWILEAVSNHTKDVKAKGPCIRIHYVKGFHVDLVAYASWQDDGGADNCRLAHETKGWRPSDPRRLLEYVDQAQAAFADTDGGTQTTQLRRIIRYLKRWDDVWLKEEGDGKPSGLAYTLLCISLLTKTMTYDGKPDDRTALWSLVSNVLSLGRVSIRKPTPEYEDVFGRLDESNMKALMARFKVMKEALEQAESELDPTDACLSLQSVFGKDFPVPSRDDGGTKTRAPAIITASSSG